jgi:DNA gyrase subunit A
MATRRGLVKKTELTAYGRPRQGGIIAIKLREGDELVDVVITEPGDEVVLATAVGMAIRFKESDARNMGRNSSGVKGVSLVEGDELVGMVVARAEDTLLTATANGYGKRTPFGPGEAPAGPEPPVGDEDGDETASAAPEAPEPAEAEGEGESESTSSNNRYRTQRRGGKGLRDIKTTERNGSVIGIVRVEEQDEVIMISARGKLQRIRASDISVIGRNTQGVRIMSLDEGDTLAAVVRVPQDAGGGEIAPTNGSAAEPSQAPDEIEGEADNNTDDN